MCALKSTHSQRLHAAVFDTSTARPDSYQSTNHEEDGRQLAQFAVSDVENCPAVLSFLSRQDALLAPFTSSLVDLLEHAAPSTYYVLVRVLMHVATFAFNTATEPWTHSVERLTSSLFLCIPFVGLTRPAYHQLLLVCQQLLIPNHCTHTWIAPLLRNVAGWIAANHLVSHVLMQDVPFSSLVTSAAVSAGISNILNNKTQQKPPEGPNNDDASITENENENQPEENETGQLEKVIVAKVCAQVPQSLAVVATATGGLAGLRERGFRETYTPERELESVCAVFELPKTDPACVLAAGGTQRESCEKAVRQLSAVDGDAVSRIFLQTASAKTSNNNNNNNNSANGMENDSQSSTNESQGDDADPTWPTGMAVRELWLELISNRVGPARVALPTRLGQDDPVSCGLLRCLLCYSLVTMRDPSCTLPPDTTFPPIDGGLVLQELNALYAMQPINSNQYWPDSIFSNLIDLVVESGGSPCREISPAAVVVNGDDWTENGLLVAGAGAGGVVGGRGREGKRVGGNESGRPWFERLPASVWEQEGDHSVTWLLFKAALKSQTQTPKTTGNVEVSPKSVQSGVLQVPEIVRECVSGNCPDLHARIFLEFRQWRSFILETYESKLRVSSGPTAGAGAGAGGEREAGLRRMDGFVSCLGEDGIDEVMALVVDNNKKFPAVGRYLTLYEKGEYSSLPDSRKRTAEDASITAMSDTSASPWATPVPKRERLSPNGYQYHQQQRRDRERERERVGSWVEGMPVGGGAGAGGVKGGLGNEVSAMVGAMAPRMLRGHVPNNREQFDKEVSDGVATWTRLQRRAPRQFDSALRTLVSTHYPSENHRLLDHVLAAFALSGPDQASLVASGLAQLVNRGSTRSFRKHPPFYAILSRFNRKSASQPAVCHAFLDVFVCSGSRARHSAFIADCLLSATLEFRQEFLRNLVHAACLECATSSSSSPSSVSGGGNGGGNMGGGGGGGGGGGVGGEMSEQLIALMHEEERNRGSGRFRDIVVPLLIQEELKGLPEGCPVGKALRRLGAAVTTYFSQPFSSDVQSTVELLFRPPSKECDTVRICSLIDSLLGVLTGTTGMGTGAGGETKPPSTNENENEISSQTGGRVQGMQEPLHLLVRGSEAGGSPAGTRWYRDYFVPCALHSISAVPQAAHLLRLTLSRPSLFSVLHPRSPSPRFGLRHLVSSIQQTCSDAELGRILHLWEGCWQGGMGGEPIPWSWLHTLLDVLPDCDPALSSMAGRLFDIYVERVFSLPVADEATWGAALSSICYYLCGTVERSGPYSSLFLHVCRHAVSLQTAAVATAGPDTRQKWFARCLSRAIRRLSRAVTSPDFHTAGLAYRESARTGVEMILLLVATACGEKSGPLYDMVCGLFDVQACQCVFSVVLQGKDDVSVRMALDILMHVVSLPPSPLPSCVTSNGDFQPAKNGDNANAQTAQKNVSAGRVSVNSERAWFWTQSRLSVMVETLISTEAPEVQEKTESLLGVLITSTESAAQQFVGCALAHFQQNNNNGNHPTSNNPTAFKRAGSGGVHLDRVAPLLELAAHHHPSIVRTVVSSVRSLLFVSPAGVATQSSLCPGDPIGGDQSGWRQLESDSKTADFDSATSRKQSLVLAGPSVLMLHVLARMWVQAPPPPHPSSLSNNNNNNDTPTPMEIDGDGSCGKDGSNSGLTRPVETDPKSSLSVCWEGEAEAATWEALDGMGWNGLEASVGQLELAHCCLQNAVFRSRLARDHLGALVAATGSPGKGSRDLATAILCQLVAGGDVCGRRLGREFEAQMRGKRGVDAVFMRRCVGALGLVLPSS